MKGKIQVVESEIQEEVVSENENTVKLCHGEALTISEGYTIAGAKRTQVIIIAGEVGSGKTSLIATLFHCLQRGPFCDYMFAGSKTLIGFDQRCHEARTSSSRAIQTMERTKSGEDRILLHLHLRHKEKLQQSVHVLFSDLSGERFRDAKDSIEECRSVPLLQRADHFVLLIDGDRICDIAKRQSAKSETIMLLQRCLDAEQLNNNSLIDLVFSKWDIVDSREDDANTLEFVKTIEVSIREKFFARVGRLRFFRIAARPDTNSDHINLGFGLEAMVPSWFEEKADMIVPRCPLNIQVPKHCEYDQFGQEYIAMENL